MILHDVQGGNVKIVCDEGDGSLDIIAIVSDSVNPSPSKLLEFLNDGEGNFGFPFLLSKKELEGEATTAIGNYGSDAML